MSVRAEWTKLRTLAGTWWLLLAVIALTAAVGAGAASAVTCQAAGCGQDPAKIALSGIDLSQAVAAIRLDSNLEDRKRARRREHATRSGALSSRATDRNRGVVRRRREDELEPSGAGRGRHGSRNLARRRRLGRSAGGRRRLDRPLVARRDPHFDLGFDFAAFARRTTVSTRAAADGGPNGASASASSVTL